MSQRGECLVVGVIKHFIGCWRVYEKFLLGLYNGEMDRSLRKELTSTPGYNTDSGVSERAKVRSCRKPTIHTFHFPSLSKTYAPAANLQRMTTQIRNTIDCKTPPVQTNHFLCAARKIPSDSPLSLLRKAAESTTHTINILKPPCHEF